MALKVVIALPCSSFKRQVRAKAQTTLLIACKFKYRVSVPPGKIQTQRSLCVSTFFTWESNRGTVPQPPGKTQVCHSQSQGPRYPEPHPGSSFPVVTFTACHPLHSQPLFFYHFSPNRLLSSLLFQSLHAKGWRIDLCTQFQAVTCRHLLKLNCAHSYGDRPMSIIRNKRIWPPIIRFY